MVSRKIRDNIFLDENYKNISNISHGISYEKYEGKPEFIEISGVLHLSYMRSDGKKAKIYANYFKKYHGLFECLLVGIPVAFENIQDTSRANYLRSLKTGLLGYLDNIGCMHYSLIDLDVNFWNGYLKWISRVDESGLQIYSAGTQLHWCSSIRTLLKSLSTIDNYKEAAKKSYSAFPRNRRSGSSKSSPRARLSNQDSRKILDAAAKEFLVVQMRISEGRRLIEEGETYNKTNEISYDSESYSSILAYLKILYPGAIPRRKDLHSDHPDIMNIMREKYNGISSFTSHSYLSPRDCVAAVLLLTFTLALNPETVLKLDYSTINEMEILGKKIVVISCEKKRSAGTQVFPISREFEIYPGINFGDILDFYTMANERLVGEVSSGHKSRVFLFCNKSKAQEARGFGKSGSAAACLACTDITFTQNLRKFIKDHDLPEFTLSQVRPTVLDELLVSTGDIKIAQTLGQQKSPWTLLNHYTSDGTKKRLEEKLGYASFILRERWWRTEGEIDPRSKNLRIRGGKSAATPGFYCLDPFDSPRPGQRKSRLCSAYGECPACMFCAASDDASDVANYLALRERLISAMTDFGELAWSSRWKPVLISLDSLLNLFSERTINDAKELFVKLPKLPKLE